MQSGSSKLHAFGKFSASTSSFAVMVLIAAKSILTWFGISSTNVGLDIKFTDPRDSFWKGVETSAYSAERTRWCFAESVNLIGSAAGRVRK